MENSIKQPLVTVIIPTIGRPDYMPMAISAAIGQSYRNIEILISDNHTSIPTANLISKHGISDHRIRVIQRDERLNFSAHMNSCISEASGDYLMILSDDDWLEPDYIEEMVTAMANTKSINVCLGRQATIGADDLTYPISNSLKACSSPLVYTGNQFIKHYLKGKGIPDIHTFVCLFASKKSLESLCGFAAYPSGAHSDNILMLRLATQGDIYVGKSTYYYRVYEKSYGLSMPFDSLVSATVLYLADISKCLTKSRLFSPWTAFYLSLRAVHSSILMVHSRYINLDIRNKNGISRRTYLRTLIRFLLATLPVPFKDLFSALPRLRFPHHLLKNANESI